jgi:flagellar hook assembly protein FlgD
VTLDIFNALGQRVRTLVLNQRQPAGAYQIIWNGLNDAGQPVANGLYVYRLQANDQIKTQKMVMMK